MDFSVFLKNDLLEDSPQPQQQQQQQQLQETQSLQQLQQQPQQFEQQNIIQQQNNAKPQINTVQTLIGPNTRLMTTPNPNNLNQFTDTQLDQPQIPPTTGEQVTTTIPLIQNTQINDINNFSKANLNSSNNMNQISSMQNNLDVINSPHQRSLNNNNSSPNTENINNCNNNNTNNNNHNQNQNFSVNMNNNNHFQNNNYTISGDPNPISNGLISAQNLPILQNSNNLNNDDGLQGALSLDQYALRNNQVQDYNTTSLDLHLNSQRRNTNGEIIHSSQSLPAFNTYAQNTQNTLIQPASQPQQQQQQDQSKQKQAEESQIIRELYHQLSGQNIESLNLQSFEQQNSSPPIFGNNSSTTDHKTRGHEISFSSFERDKQKLKERHNYANQNELQVQTQNINNQKQPMHFINADNENNNVADGRDNNQGSSNDLTASPKTQRRNQDMMLLLAKMVDARSKPFTEPRIEENQFWEFKNEEKKSFNDIQGQLASLENNGGSEPELKKKARKQDPGSVVREQQLNNESSAQDSNNMTGSTSETPQSIFQENLINSPLGDTAQAENQVLYTSNSFPASTQEQSNMSLEGFNNQEQSLMSDQSNSNFSTCSQQQQQQQLTNLINLLLQQQLHQFNAQGNCQNGLESLPEQGHHSNFNWNETTPSYHSGQTMSFINHPLVNQEVKNSKTQSNGSHQKSPVEKELKEQQALLSKLYKLQDQTSNPRELNEKIMKRLSKYTQQHGHTKDHHEKISKRNQMKNKAKQTKAKPKPTRDPPPVMTSLQADLASKVLHEDPHASSPVQTISNNTSEQQKKTEPTNKLDSIPDNLDHSPPNNIPLNIHQNEDIKTHWNNLEF